MWQHILSEQCLDETVVKMLEENKPYKKHFYVNYTLYELNHSFIQHGKKYEGNFLIVVQKNKKPWTAQCHQFSFKNAKFVVCENVTYSVFRLEK